MDKLKYFADEAFNKDQLLQEISKVATDSIKGEITYEDAIGLILARCMGISAKSLNELKELNNEVEEMKVIDKRGYYTSIGGTENLFNK